MLQLKHPRIWLALGWCFVVIALVGFLLPGHEIEKLHLNSLNDKLMHASVFAVMFLWFAGIYPPARYAAIACWLLAMGVMVEVLQAAMHMGRSGEVADVVADGFGIALGMLLALKVLGGWAQRAEEWAGKS